MLKHIACSSLFALLAANAPAAVLISEVLYNESGSNTAGEWIEIYNNGTAMVSLAGWKIGDEETSGGTTATEAMFEFPGSATIAAGQIQIVSVNADQFFAVYGFLPAWELAGGPSDNASVPNLSVYSAWDPDGGLINMSNSNDHAVLLNASDAVADAVNWVNTGFLNPGLADGEADGQSYYRIDPSIDTDTAADWALTPGGTGASTPGVVPVPEPASGLLALAAAGVLLRRRRECSNAIDASA